MATDPEPDRGPLAFTDQRIVDQLAHLVPQIHLTLVSILQSVALAFLLASVRLPSSASWVALWSTFGAHNFYLPHIASFLLIVIAWNEYAYATIFLHWPLTALSTSLQFLFVVVEIAAVTSVDNVGAWTLWFGLTALLGALVHLRNVRITDDNLYPHHSVSQDILHNSEWLIWALSCCLIVVGVFMIFGFGLFGYSLEVGSIRIVVADSIVPLVVVAAELFVLRADDRFYVRNINRIFEKSTSPYRLDPNGRITLKAPSTTTK